MDLQPYSNPKVGWQEQRMWLKVFVLSLSQKDWHDLWLSFLILVFCHALFINVEKKKKNEMRASIKIGHQQYSIFYSQFA